MNRERSIWITGVGVVSAAGGDASRTLATFRTGERRAGPVTRFETTLTCPVFEAADLPEGEPGEISRTVRLALRAVEEALDAAGRPHEDPGIRVGVCLGTTVASQLNDIGFYRAYCQDARPDLAPVRRFLAGNLARNVADAVGATGPRACIVNACSSGADAIGLGASWLGAGLCDVVIAGGADELDRVPLTGFHSLGIVSQRPCAPFDRDRDGLNLGEGAGIVVLETQASARRRGRDPGVWLAGYGAACDAHHLTAPHPHGRGLKQALAVALRSAGVVAEQIAFVNAHGTATLENDLVEGQTLAEVFGPGVLALSTKGYTGHTLGAAGGLEAVFTALALAKGWLPSSVGFVTHDPAIPLRPITEPTSFRGDVAVSTSLAFGGANAFLVLRRAGV